MITDYASLQAYLADELLRGDLGTKIPNFIQLCEADMTRRLNTREMEVFTNLTLSGDEVALPDDFRKLLNIEIVGGTYKLQSVERNFLDGLPVRGGEARYYTLQGDAILFYPSPSSGTVNIRYKQAIPALSDTNTSNWLLEKHPDAYQYGSLMRGALYLKDPKNAAAWGTLFQTAIDQINEEACKALEPARLQTRHSFNTYEGRR